ncbi:hypothetical protein VTN31DRAFT_6052 [Thermomyces dupontii]|uniref:uncharacterized protein n=1 Tax=Talaromyces thermophilus TaxID=28565 RepID=UPI00374361FE
MSEQTGASGGAAQGPATEAKAPPRPPNPVFKMLGLPNVRFRLPSRNWMIFWTVVGSFTAAVIYDRRQKRHVQQKWSDLVAHISKEALPVNQSRRTLTVFLAAPPGDGLRAAREYFIDYVKPILVSAALDYEVIEGRKEGDIRAGLAEKIRKQRRLAGEPSTVKEEDSKDTVIADLRRQKGIQEEPGPRGDIVIGRHTWKEYIRGLHEGWLGPLDPPSPPPTTTSEAQDTATSSSESPAEKKPEGNEGQNKDQDEKKEETKEEKKQEDEKPKGPTPAYITPAEYASRDLPRSIPDVFESSAPIPFPHLLGFLNTPIRIYRFLNRRYLADDVGREVAAVVLASASRPYHESTTEAAVSDADSATSTATHYRYEQEGVLAHEEQDWHKSVRKALQARKEQRAAAAEASPTATTDGDSSQQDQQQQQEPRRRPGTLENEEREWIDDIVLDPRIAQRMRRYVLAPEEEERAQRIAEGKEWILGQGERPKQVSFWKRLWIDYGYGVDEEALKRKPIIGNLDDE